MLPSTKTFILIFLTGTSFGLTVAWLVNAVLLGRDIIAPALFLLVVIAGSVSLGRRHSKL